MKKIQLISLLLFAINISNAQTIFVKSSNAINGDGTSWSLAYNNLQDAISQATSTNEIWVSQGTYYPSKDTTGSASPTDNRLKTFFINKNIKLYGGFLGTETMLSAANPAANATILSGDIGTISNNQDNIYHVIWLSSASGIGNINNTCILNGFTITKGYGDTFINGALPNNQGGAIYFNAVGATKTMSPRIENCIFSENNARQGGALYFNSMGNAVAPVFEKCVFKNNNAIGNTPATPNGQGGAIHFSTRTLTRNEPIFNSCIFLENRGGGAGAIYNILYSGISMPSFNSCYFIKNTANSGGVMYNCSNGPTEINKPLLINCGFSENVGNNIGGCIYNIANQGETSSTLINCTFSKNTSANGPTMYNTKTASAFCNPIIKNSIIWNVSTEQNEISNNNSSTTTISNSIISDGIIDGTITPSTGNTYNNSKEANPMYWNINDLDGIDNIMHTVDDGLNVQQGSPVINMGDNSVINSGLNKIAKLNGQLAITKDITGVTDRIVDGVVDIGAFEFVAAIPLPLKLIAFSAEKLPDGIHLNWQTADEINVQSFEIERSIDAKKFEKIGYVLAKNNSESQFYTFIDSQKVVESELLYYRLKMIDMDLSFQYSKIINLKIERINSFYVFPNPVKETLKVADNEMLNFNYNTIEIINLNGNTIKGLTINSNGLDVGRLPFGIYFLKLENGKLLRFIKE